MIKTKSLQIFGFIAVFLTAHSSVLAASFDCAKANTERKKIICSDPDLSDLDSQLGRVYQERRALLSPHGAELLQRSEKNWRRFVTIMCPLDAPGNMKKWLSPKDCLLREYRDRLAGLSKVGQKVGPFIFNRIDLFAAEKVSDSSDDSDSEYGPQYQKTAYPQIDNINTSATDLWNKHAVTKLFSNDRCESYGNTDVDYTIGFASDRMISTTWSMSIYCPGAAHGFYTSRTENMVLTTPLHKLQPAELFGSENAWIPNLQALFWDALQEQGWEPKDLAAKEEILQIVVAPDRWLFTDDGLMVDFDSYEGGCYTCSPKPVTVSWAKLKPLLIPDSVLP